jgi:hypothetical protein
LWRDEKFILRSARRAIITARLSASEKSQFKKRKNHSDFFPLKKMQKFKRTKLINFKGVTSEAN